MQSQINYDGLTQSNPINTMKTLKFFRFIEGRLEAVDSFTLVKDGTEDPYSYLVVVLIDGIPVRSMII